MKRTIFTFALAFLLIGCGADITEGDSACSVADNGDGSATLSCNDGSSATVGGSDCAVPSSTFTMHYEWSEAEMFRRDCWNEAKFEHHECVQNGTEYSECTQIYDEREQYCLFTYAGWVNKIPIRECGAKIFDVTGIPGDANYSFGVHEGDDDGDGIDNWHEYLMGLNPCTPNAYGSCTNDADLDFDVDGIPNGQDEDPDCNLDDPAGQFSDCV